MTIQINSDNHIKGSENLIERFKETITNSLKRFENQVTRVVVHLNDENGSKSGQKDKRCLLEARLEGMQPIAVTHHANTLDEALKGAIDKIKTSLETSIGKLRSY